MQIQCTNCRNVMAVSPQGGQFQCPTCGAINSVGAPVQMGIPVQAQYVGARPPPPKTDNRRAYVLLAFLVFGIGALVVGWSALALGLPLLGWAIAGAAGKVKSPLALVFPESTKTKGLAAVGIALGGMVTTCAMMGGAAQQNKAEKERLNAEANAERIAAAKAEKERLEAEEAAARDKREAELRSEAAKAGADYSAGLDAVEALMKKDKMVEAGKKLQEVASAVEEYKKLNPVPKEIAAVMPRQAEITPKLTESLQVVAAAKELDENLKKAADLTEGNKDGENWQTAQGLWEAAAANIDTLEGASPDLKRFIPDGLAEKRKTIEKMLGKAEGIVNEYEKTEAARAAYSAACGDSGCIEVSAKDLLRDYENNEAAAQSRWKGQRVAVTGVVESVALDLFDEPFVSIKAKGDRYGFQTVHCEPANDAAANKLNKGQGILAVGTVGAEVIGSVVLEDCVF